MPAQKFNTKRKTITQAIGAATVETITHDLGRVARLVTFKQSGAEDVEFIWNDKSGSTTQIDIDNSLGGAYGAIEINIIAY